MIYIKNQEALFNQIKSIYYESYSLPYYDLLFISDHYINESIEGSDKFVFQASFATI